MVGRENIGNNGCQPPPMGSKDYRTSFDQLARRPHVRGEKRVRKGTCDVCGSRVWQAMPSTLALRSWTKCVIHHPQNRCPLANSAKRMAMDCGRPIYQCGRCAARSAVERLRRLSQLSLRTPG